MKHFYLSFIFTIISCVGMGLHAESTCLTINFVQGDVARFAIPEKPIMTFDGDHLTVKTSEGITASYPRADVKDFDFTQGTTSAIEAVTVDNGYSVAFDAATITIGGESLTTATIYDVAGNAVASAQADGDAIVLTIDNLAEGVYVVDIAGHRSLKFKK